MDRTTVYKELLDFFSAKWSKSELIYFRGRRRIGKSTLLVKLGSETNAFYFMGAKDERDRATRTRFVSDWSKFSPKSGLGLLKSSALDWDSIFEDLRSYASKSTKPLCLILDEIQWLAKGQSGFISLLKKAWLGWEATKNIRLIVCGSSNKFFVDQTAGEEKILRGLRTRADLWLPQFSFGDAIRQYFKSWKLEEAAVAYMLLGGVPYYLNQLEPERGFVRAINDALFLNKTIFLSEVDEVLNLDFNTRGLKTCKKILSSLAHEGSTLSAIKDKSSLPAATLSEAVEKLCSYGLLFENKYLELHQNPGYGKRYQMQDFYLNCFFHLLSDLKAQIEDNTNSLLFAELLSGGYSIAPFTGYAFERLARTMLHSETVKSTGLFNKLGLADRNYEVLNHSQTGKSVDIVIRHNKERTLRIMECKWSQNTEVVLEGISQLAGFETTSDLAVVKRALLLPRIKSKSWAKAAAHAGVEILDLSDLVDSAWNT